MPRDGAPGQVPVRVPAMSERRSGSTDVSEAAAGEGFVSVVIPVYNDPEGLGECLHALSAQTYREFEAIVVDNGSKDWDDAMVASFPFVRVVREPRPGSYNARNTGVQVSRGGLLAFTDADCRPRPGWLAGAVSYLQSNPEVDAIGGGIELVGASGASAAVCFERVFAFRQQRYVSDYGFAFTANMITRRSVFERVGPFDGSVKSGGDRDWGQRLQLLGGRLEFVEGAIVEHPARATLRALVQKRRRLEGGRRRIPPIANLVPGWGDRPKVRAYRGWRLGLALLVDPSAFGVGRAGAFKALLVAGLLVAVGMIEDARLRMGGSPLR
jgi:cellulose synthase/poly-beta-1,6-N-acetylglucosamine synthase-like glycosyltransferase